MKLFFPLSCIRGSRVLAVCGIFLAVTSVGIVCSPAQDAQPDPTPAGTPATDPTASPSDTPAPVTTPAPASTPPPVLTPGLPDPSVIADYNALRTPLVDVTLSTTSTASGTTSGVSVANATKAAGAVRQNVQGNVCTQVTLPRPATAGAKASHATSSTTGAASQPVATVVLTYDPSHAGELVWVQMLSTGTLTADDGAGHTYDGSQGFFLTLDANAMATFNYQAPNVSGTYQVFTRLGNVATVLPFFVPDPAP